jgi:hypothetical protein
LWPSWNLNDERLGSIIAVFLGRGTIQGSALRPILIRSFVVKNTSDTASIPENKAKDEESAGPISRRESRKDILKKILLVIVVVFAWLAIKRLVITLGNETLMILLFIVAAILVILVLQKIKW